MLSQQFTQLISWVDFGNAYTISYNALCLSIFEKWVLPKPFTNYVVAYQKKQLFISRAKELPTTIKASTSQTIYISRISSRNSVLSRR